ncbi:3-hydroxyacyl-ACP dehydratase FabZ [Thermodesulfobacteriota bacterium]
MGRSLDVQEIMRILPHRYPFVMLDRIVDYEAGVFLTAIKNVTINEQFFQGHFPEEPVMPGVLVLEGMAQAACMLAFLTFEEYIRKKIFYLAGFDNTKFRRKVTPGDQLRFELKPLKTKLRFWVLEGKTFVGEDLVAEAVIKAGFADIAKK